MNQTQNPIQGGRPILSKIQMHKYQDRAVAHILSKKKSALWLDMGL